jgi:hydrogenase-4 component B
VALVGLGGAVCLFGDRSAGAGFDSGLGPAVGVDPLSGAFLAIVAVVAAPAALYASGYLRGARHAVPLAVLTGLFQIVLVGVLTARDVTTFLAFWELMTLVPAAAILVARDGAPARRAVFEYLAITHIGGAGVWIAMILLAAHGALGDPAGMAAAGPALTATVAIAGIVGFGTKAGLVPFHAWLPRAHPLAPAHVSALMSGAMVNVGLYGIARLLLEWIGRPEPWMGLLLMGLGAASALVGVAYALFQRDLKRLLAFSTIENVGIIAVALGAAAVFVSQGQERWAGVAVAAALLQALAHAAAKALLFLGAGSMDRAAGEPRLDRMGGVLARMPWTGGAALVGALTMAGVPLLGLFASEWLTLQALLRLGRDGGVAEAVAGGLVTAVLGATVALAAYCFVAFIGLGLLGRPRTEGYREAREVPVAMRAPVVALAGACVLVGLAPGLVAPRLAELAPGGAGGGLGVGLSVPGASLRTLGIALALAVAAAGAAALRGRRSARPAPVWNCGQDPAPALEWTAAAFSKPANLAFQAVLRPEREVSVTAPGGVVRGVRHDGGVPHLFDARVYAPVLRGALAGAVVARRLQSGNLRQYVASLVALVLVLLALVRTGLLG